MYLQSNVLYHRARPVFRLNPIFWQMLILAGFAFSRPFSLSFKKSFNEKISACHWEIRHIPNIIVGFCKWYSSYNKISGGVENFWPIVWLAATRQLSEMVPGGFVKPFFKKSALGSLHSHLGAMQWSAGRFWEGRKRSNSMLSFISPLCPAAGSAVNNLQKLPWKKNSRQLTRTGQILAEFSDPIFLGLILISTSEQKRLSPY